MSNPFTKRYVANITLEAASPLKVGSSELDMLQDAPVQKDFNGLPMILGTSLAGMMREAYAEGAEAIFGESEGSRVILSNALVCDENMKVQERLLLQKSAFLEQFETLPQREHVRITDKGVAQQSGKFDEEVVYAGTRFKFRMELLADEQSEELFERLIAILDADSFRVGGGTTKGFGDMKLLREFSSYDTFEITSPEYRAKDASLNTTFNTKLPSTDAKNEKHTKYELILTSDDFFMFGSGFGDDDADATPVHEQLIDYDAKDLSLKKILIPASSIKGALAHRVAFHYNKEMLKQGKEHTKVAEDNSGVVAIFGHKKELVDGRELGEKGKVLMSDLFLESAETKIFDHVAIDRFTGGAIESALFNEKTLTTQEQFKVEILLEKDVDADAQAAFEAALRDITTGMLPLGGMTTKGHGVFSGECLKDGEKL